MIDPNLRDDLDHGLVRPILPDIFRLDEMGTVRFVGSECTRCRARAFPVVFQCQRCQSPVNSVMLADTGRVDTYTVVRQGPQEWKGGVPYTLVRVILDDETMVVGHLHDSPGDLDNCPGLKVQSGIAVLYEEDGQRVAGPVFFPR